MAEVNVHRIYAPLWALDDLGISVVVGDKVTLSIMQPTEWPLLLLEGTGLAPITDQFADDTYENRPSRAISGNVQSIVAIAPTYSTGAGEVERAFQSGRTRTESIESDVGRFKFLDRNQDVSGFVIELEVPSS